MDQQAVKDKTERVTGLSRGTREGIAKWNQITALRFQTRGRHQTSPASFPGPKIAKLRRKKQSSSQNWSKKTMLAMTKVPRMAATHHTCPVFWKAYKRKWEEPT